MNRDLSPRSFARASLGLLALAFSSFALHPACSSNSGGGDAGTNTDAGLSDAGTHDAGTHDAGTHDGGAADAGCTTDAQCGSKRYCEKSNGTCLDAKPCPQGQGNCDYQGSGGDYCAGAACYCDPADSSCKPLHVPCSPCDSSPQCGNDQNDFNQPADCLPGSAGFADASVCIPHLYPPVVETCPPGFTQPTDGGPYCTPAGGRCGAPGGCHSDQDCDPHGATPICDTAHGVCASACTFDLKTGVSLCPTGQVCNLLPTFASLPPSDPNFAKGRCGPPCTSGVTNCGTGLVCRSEGVDMQVMRCGLPPPECLGDVECPNAPSAHSNGYCDLSSKTCKVDCRTTGDCTAGYICAQSNGVSACVAETCLQAGGATQGCDYGQFCCGEMNSPSCPGGVQSGACYDKPALWCSSCSQDSDCSGSSYPSRSGEVNLCVGAANGNVCAFGCDPSTSGECPRGWSCEKVVAGCGQDSDCGNQATAKCSVEDGGNGTCTCQATGDCPQGPPASTCTSGECVITHVCNPNCN